MVPTFKEFPCSWKGGKQTNFDIGYEVLWMHREGHVTQTGKRDTSWRGWCPRQVSQFSQVSSRTEGRKREKQV